jgi:hypothetical protein
MHNRTQQAAAGAARYRLRQLWSDGESGLLLLVCMLTLAQVAAFCVSAIGGGTMFVRWWRMAEEDRSRVWRLYGWLSGLMCIGSVFGAVSWSSWMQNLVANFNGSAPGLTRAQSASWNASGQYWTAAFLITYGIEFLCLSVAKLMVLDRMMEFAAKGGDAMSRRLAVGGRVVMAVVVVGNVVGLCGNIAAAVYYKEAGDFNTAAAAAFAAGSTADGTILSERSILKGAAASNAQSVQQFCEVAVLLIIILAFAVVGIACARRVSAALRRANDEQGDVGRQLRRQIVGTAAFVFVTFLLRAMFSIMNALANALQNDTNFAACPNFNCNPTCFNEYALMQYWLILTPEFQLTIILISSSLASLVALWGMTSQRAVQLMKKSSRGEMATLRTSGPPGAA